MERFFSRQEVEEIIKEAFTRGEAWGVCYSTWFTPSQLDTLNRRQTAIDEIFKLYQ